MKPAGRDLDALIAEKVMGWTRDGTGINWYCRPDGIRVQDPAPFSTDISAAWEVATVMFRRGYSMETCTNPAEITTTVFTTEDHDEHGRHRSFVGKATTSAASICLAALKAVGVE